MLAAVVGVLITTAPTASACVPFETTAAFTGRPTSIEEGVVQFEVLARPERLADGVTNRAPAPGQTIAVRFNYDAQFFELERNYDVIASTLLNGDFISGVQTNEPCDGGRLVATTYVGGGLVDRTVRSRNAFPYAVGVATLVLATIGVLVARRARPRIDASASQAGSV